MVQIPHDHHGCDANAHQQDGEDQRHTEQNALKAIQLPVDNHHENRLTVHFRLTIHFEDAPGAAKWL